MNFTSKGQVRKVTVDAVVIRNDGTREDLGTVAYYHKNPLMRVWFAMKQNIKYIFS